MTEFQWILCVFGAFALYFTVARLWNKDNRGAMLCVLAVVVIAALFLISGCAVTPAYRPWMEAGVAYDVQGTVGDQPSCVVRVRQPLVPERLILGYQHISSCPDLQDRNTVDAVEMMAVIPLGRTKH